MLKLLRGQKTLITPTVKSGYSYKEGRSGKFIESEKCEFTLITLRPLLLVDYEEKGSLVFWRGEDMDLTLSAVLATTRTQHQSILN